MEIEGKKIIVTGGANGIGKSLVLKLMEQKAIVGVFDIDHDALRELKDENPNIFYKVCDLSEDSQAEKAVNDFFNKFSSIDVLVNNAGILSDFALIKLFGSIKKHDVDIWNKVIATNLSSVFYMTRHVVDKMFKKRTKGLIINVSSISAEGEAGQTAYSASKAGVNALTKTWAKELSPLGIRVAGIAPGLTKTKMVFEAMNEKIIADWVNKIPLKRMANASEIADGIIFIIKNDYFNGKILEIDGGLKI